MMTGGGTVVFITGGAKVVGSNGGVGLVNSGRGGAVVVMTGLSGARAADDRRYRA